MKRLFVRSSLCIFTTIGIAFGCFALFPTVSHAASGGGHIDPLLGPGGCCNSSDSCGGGTCNTILQCYDKGNRYDGVCYN